MNAIRALVRKDLLVFFRDRRALLMSFLTPIILGAFMGYFFSGNEQSVSKIPVAVVDLDQSPVSRKMVAGLSKDKAVEVQSFELGQAREGVRKGKVAAGLVLPCGFGATATRNFFRADTKQVLTLLVDPSRSAEAAVVRGLLAQYSMEATSGEVFGGPAGLEMLKESADAVEKNADMEPSTKKALRELYGNVATLNAKGAMADGGGKGAGLSLPYELKEEAVTSKTGVRYNGYAHSFAGMGVQFILFMGIEGGMALLLLRQSSLWRRLRMAPVGRHSILVARILSSAIIAAVLLLGIFAVARLAFGVKIQGSLPGFLLLTATFALFTGAFGLLIAALGRTPEATRGLSILATLFMLMLGGAWVPAFLFPPWLQKASLAFPTRWAIDGLEAMTWRGLGFSAALAPAGVLLGFSVVMGILAWSRFPFEDA